MGLSDRLVVVTGADGALGRGLATAFHEAGARVLAVTRVPGRDPIPGAVYDQADLTEEDSVAALFERAGTPWAVVNTVGGFAPHRPLAELDVKELGDQLTLNLLTASLLTKYALTAMLPVGEGRIIHTASRAATNPSGSGFAYSVSKAGVIHLVQMAAADLAKTRVRINAVSPAIIDTPANRAAIPTADHGKWPAPAQIAGTYLYLASSQAEVVNGAVLPV